MKKIVAIMIMMLLALTNVDAQNNNPTGSTPSSIVTVKSKPGWLLIAGKDIKASQVKPPTYGKVIYFKEGTESILGDPDPLTPMIYPIIFEVKNYGPGDMALAFSKDNKVVYYKGKGWITNLLLKERIILPPQ